ncbi:alpha-ketoacid dehydrogenase subunit beta [Tsuneonella flava]|uniref:Alpha-ketoacid dehydrogenase subunit beta n=1 Tax=Tsuneonella flava TaxID=2055955 RepID=A0ABX7KAN0_9SPHN|nr:transketolase C-terminal domain-containing protein [Tsuneonella flava]QSB45034.1 alpha-ketoacid dehydrogenase subunit beta [Tsuneonella flava]
MTKMQYCEGILAAFEYVMENDPRCLAIGQGLWSPWYVGRSMDGLDKKFGKNRVIDTPVSEQATTGIAIGAALNGYKPIVIHPRMDFMILATDQIVNQAAKWRHMLGGATSPAMVIRGIVNRGGEQGAQHSQALHSWYAHIPGLRVVMPATPADARDLLIAAVQSPDPVLYIDDRWLYELEDDVPPPCDVDLSSLGPQLLRDGSDLTIGAASYSTRLALDAAQALHTHGVSCAVVDARVLNPFDPGLLRQSVRRTGRLLAVDGGWETCGFAGEMIAAVVEGVEPRDLRTKPARITLPHAPAPTSKPLEAAYYPTVSDIVEMALSMVAEGK